MGGWLWVLPEEEQRQWRIAQVVSKDRRSISLQAQRLAPDASRSSAKKSKLSLKSKGNESSLHSWEPITLEHGKFPVLYCNAHEISEAVAEAGEPSSSGSSGTSGNSRASPTLKSKRASSSSPTIASTPGAASGSAAPALTAVASTEDLSTLPQLHEASIVHTLHRRATADPNPQVLMITHKRG